MKFNKIKKTCQLAIEMDEDYIKWSVADLSHGNPQILEMGAILSEPREKAREVFSELQEKYRFEPEKIMACVSRRQVTTRNLEVPSTDSDEIKKIVGLQAVKQTPYALDEIVYDFYKLPLKRESYSNVLLVAAHRNIVNAHLTRFESWGLKAGKITLATQGSALWILKQVGLSKQRETRAILSIDFYSTDFFICEDHDLLFTHSVSMGAAKLSEQGTDAIERLMADIVRAYQTYRHEGFFKEATCLLVGGAFENFRSAFEKLEKDMGLKVQEVALPSEFQNFVKQPEWLKRFSFAPVLGLQLKSKLASVNLVPQEVLLREEVIEKGKYLMIAGVLVLTFFLVAVSFFGFRFYEKKSYLKWLEVKVNQTSPEAGEVSKLKKSVKYAQVIQGKNNSLLQVIARLHEKLPNEIYLTDINYTKDNHFRIEGWAENITNVFSFVESLKKEPCLRDLETKNLSKRIMNNKEMVDFEIDSQLVAEPSTVAQGAPV